MKKFSICCIIKILCYEVNRSQLILVYYEVTFLHKFYVKTNIYGMRIY